MKIAIISTRQPSLDSGADIRNYYLQKLLSKKYDVKSYVPIFSKTLNVNQDGVLPLLPRLTYLLLGKIPYIERLKHMIFSKDDLNELKVADAIQLEELNSFYLFEKYIKDYQGKIILDTHNIDYLRFLAESNNKGTIERLIGRILAAKLKHMEINAIKKLDHIIVCSEVEKEYFSKYVSSNKITVIPNGVNCKRFGIVNQIEGDKILFMGLLSYPPNAKGLKYYIEHVHPKVIRKVPNAELIIIGKGASKWLKDMAKNDNSIKLVGFVTDVREYIKKAKVCICPIFSGSGTRLKLLEYMAMGKPVVSTIKGSEGINVTNNINILLAKNANEFIDKIITLIKDEKLCRKIGGNGRKLVEKQFDWEDIGNKINNFYTLYQN